MKQIWERLTDPLWWYAWYRYLGIWGNLIAGLLILWVTRWMAEVWAAISRALLRAFWQHIVVRGAREAKKALWMLNRGLREAVRWLYHRYGLDEENKRKKK